MIEVAAVVGAGLLSGVYAAFSTIVIPALRNLGDLDATAAMVRINKKAERGPFIVIFGLAALAAAALAVASATQGAVIGLVIAGASLASTVLTIAVNVPLNRRLERDGPAFWAEYSARWTRANTVRAAFAAAAVIAAGLHWYVSPITVGG